MVALLLRLHDAEIELERTQKQVQNRGWIKEIGQTKDSGRTQGLPLRGAIDDVICAFKSIVTNENLKKYLIKFITSVILISNHDLTNLDLKVGVNMFVGRKNELEFFNERYNKKGAQLIVLYGRRRVGKTELLREFCKDKPHVFYSATECTDKEQLSAFSSRMLKDNPMSSYLKNFENWEQAISFVTQLPYSEKKLIVIDEFPYMVSGNTSIPSILQNLWDEKLSRENVMIVLCGSSMSFIEKEVLADKNPLYGRATGILKMNEMNFFDSSEFFSKYSSKDKFLAYSILGGIPHYLKQFDDDLSLDDNIKKNILSRGSVLYNEVEFLMHQELRETTVYNTIISAVALGNTRLNDIYQKTQIDKAKISVYLKNLIELGILKKEFPATEGVKQEANVQRGLYIITDHYFRFWYRFLFSNMSELEGGDVEGVYNYSIKSYIDEYSSKAFEEVCIQYLRELNKKNNLPIRYAKIGRYWDKNVEIDIMAFDKDDNYIIGECKWRNTRIGMRDYNELKEKVDELKIKNPYLYFFSKSGFTEELKAYCKDNKKIVLVDLEKDMII